MKGWKLLAGGALLLIAQGVAAFEEEDIELTMHDEFYSQKRWQYSDEGTWLTVAVTHRAWLGQEAAERDIPSEESPGLLQGDPVLTIGAWPVAEETHVIENPVRVLLPGDSTLIVLDARSREIRAFGLDGTLFWRAGGIGEGPGEFPSPALSLFSLRAGAELVAVDASATRVNIYTRRGSLIESLGLPSAADC